ncbi:MAG: CDP-diacylglycerol--glycerol-3-phosphate 3-phosphatidyltransferase [Candidatus Margulisbacteria bacterium]|nr:CDP-diacylglycerol--glycerol-3-phosphate 3-phosphatidyltransferase [Candidatus Margulisiibacteriota bacterium]
MTLANRITLLRVALIPLCIIFLLAGFYGLAAVIFLLLSFSDAIDGYIARKYNQVSELGKQLDPLADKILVLTVLIALTALGKAGPVAVMLILVREFVIASIRTAKVFAASPIAKWKTIIQMAAVFMCILSLPLSELVLWLAVILSYISGVAYLWQSPFFKQLKLS